MMGTSVQKSRKESAEWQTFPGMLNLLLSSLQQLCGLVFLPYVIKECLRAPEALKPRAVNLRCPYHARITVVEISDISWKVYSTSRTIETSAALLGLQKVTCDACDVP